MLLHLLIGQAIVELAGAFQKSADKIHVLAKSLGMNYQDDSAKSFGMNYKAERLR